MNIIFLRRHSSAISTTIVTKWLPNLNHKVKMMEKQKNLSKRYSSFSVNIFILLKIVIEHIGSMVRGLINTASNLVKNCVVFSIYSMDVFLSSNQSYIHVCLFFHHFIKSLQIFFVLFRKIREKNMLTKCYQPKTPLFYLKLLMKMNCSCKYIVETNHMVINMLLVKYIIEIYV